MFSRKKTATETAISMAEKSNYQDARTDNDTRPAIIEWDRLSFSDDDAPDASAVRWGADREHLPDWASYTLADGTAVSDAVLLAAEKHDTVVRDDAGNVMVKTSVLRVRVTQGVDQAYPAVLILRREFTNGDRGKQVARVSLYPHEVGPLVTALSAALALVNEGEGR